MGKCECKCRMSNIDKHQFQRDLQVMDNMKFKVDSISVLNALPLPLKQKEDFFFFAVSLILATNSTWRLQVREMEVGKAWKISWITKAQQLELSF